MAKIRSNVIVQGLSGGLGEQLMFRRLRDGRTIVCLKPDFSRRKLSQEQQAHHQKFRAAAAYARQAAKHQPIYAELAAGTLKTAYNIALSDWFHAPVIHGVEWRGGRLLIRASDNVQVCQVRVEMREAEGQVLERGEAVQLGGVEWEYAPQGQRLSGRRVWVEAQDLAGNVTQAEQALEEQG